MKIRFERMYGEHKIGDVVEFEKGEELDYILTTKTALVIEDDDFGNNEIDDDKETNKTVVDTETENNNEIGKSKKTRKNKGSKNEL